MRLIYYFCTVCLLLLTTAVVADTYYKSVDGDGNVIYTDAPSPDAEAIINPSPNTVTMPKPKPEQPAEQAAAPAYKQFAIVSPAHAETIRSNPGTVNIAFAIVPALDVKAGHRIAVFVDGYVMIKNATQTTLSLADINRGTHKLFAIIIDKQNQRLIKSQDIEFFMKRESLLLNKPPPPPSPPATP